MLCHIQSSGIMAFCSDLIVHPEEQKIAYFLSISGYQTAVKGIIANFLEYNGLNLDHDGKRDYIQRSYFNYTVRLKKLPSGLVHAIVIPNLALSRNEEEKRNSFFIFTSEQKDIQTLFFRHLDDLTNIPMHQSWTSWLWNFFSGNENWLITLETIIGSYQGFMVEFNSMQLQDTIADAIRNKIPEIINCIERS